MVQHMSLQTVKGSRLERPAAFEGQPWRKKGNMTAEKSAIAKNRIIVIFDGGLFSTSFPLVVSFPLPSL